MKAWRRGLLIATLMTSAGIPAVAQVEKVGMRTPGIACGSCAAVAEVYLKQLPGVDKVTISMSNEAVIVSYKPGTTFSPSTLRDSLAKTDVSVQQFQITARGRVQELQGKRYFIAGKDKFVILAASPAKVPSDTPISIEGIVNDKPNPMELKVLSFKALKQ